MLPGLDGTGLMFETFLRYSNEDYEFCVEPLQAGEDQAIWHQVEAIELKYQDQKVYLLAESYSGRIAYELLLRNKLSVEAVIFVASFVWRPSRWVSFARLLPLTWLKKGWFPKALVSRMLFGQKNQTKAMQNLLKSLRSVRTSVLRARLQQLAEMQKPNAEIATPCLYLKPEKDRLVAGRCVQEISNLFKDFEMLEIPGTHFLMQSNPEGCMRTIVAYLQQKELKK